MGFGCERKARTIAGLANDPADFGGQGAQAEQPAAGHLVGARRSGVVSVIIDARYLGSAMMDHVGMGHAVHRV
jgi:hypothetical protein